MARLVIGIIVGVILSAFSVAIFSMFAIPLYDDILKTITLLFGLNFEFDLISFFTSAELSILGFFAPPVLGWLVVGYVSGSIAQGVKRGLTASLLVVVLDLLIWILLSVVTQQDLMALFQGAQLMTTLGGIVGAIAPAVLGGVLGALASGEYEEFY